MSQRRRRIRRKNKTNWINFKQFRLTRTLWAKICLGILSLPLSFFFVIFVKFKKIKKKNNKNKVRPGLVWFGSVCFRLWLRFRIFVRSQLFAFQFSSFSSSSSSSSNQCWKVFFLVLLFKEKKNLLNLLLLQLQLIHIGFEDIF